MNEGAQEIIGVTQKFCARMAATQFSELPKKAIDEAKRGVLDWLGCALAGSRHPTLDRLFPVLQ